LLPINPMFFLGINIGISETRAVVLDLEGARVIAEAVSPHRWVEGLPDGHKEQDPVCWIEAVDRSVRQCLDKLGPTRGKIAAMGVSGSQQGIVVLDRENRVVRPTKMAGDYSARRQAEEISRAFGGSPGLIELAGNPLSADTAAAQCLWLKQHEPYHFQRAAAIMPIKDFINYWLTGEVSTEPGAASGTGMFDIRRRCWSNDICSLIDSRLIEMLPKIGSSIEPRGILRQQLANSWGLDPQIIVSQGSGTQMLSCLAAGCVASGRVSLELGNTGVLSGIANEPCVDLRGEVSALCDATGQWLATVVTANAVAAPEMVRRHYGWSAELMEQMVAASAPGADGLLFLPYVTGEKTPSLPEASGVIHGITLDNYTPANIARATAEGVSLGLGYGLGRMRELGFEPREIQVTGAGSGSKITRQLLADVFGVPVVGLSSPQGPAFGAAIHAALVFFRHSGETLQFEEMAQYLVSVDESTRCLPNNSLHTLYQDLISRQQYLVDTLHPAGFL
jgi:xylulokinase